MNYHVSSIESRYSVPVVASHGKEGVEKAISEKPKLILMDIRMPVMDGWQAAKALRANPDTMKIPILAITELFRPDELKQPAWKRAVTATSSSLLALWISRGKLENC